LVKREWDQWFYVAEKILRQKGFHYSMPYKLRINRVMDHEKSGFWWKKIFMVIKYPYIKENQKVSLLTSRLLN